MKKNKNSDHDIEFLFSQLPKIEDYRKCEEIYARLSEEPQLKKRKKKWAPILVSFATICLLAITSSIYIFQEFSTDEQSQNQSKQQMANRAEENEEADSIPEKVSIMDTESEEYLNGKSPTRAGLLYDNQLENTGYLTIGIPTKDAQYVVPLTFVYNHETMDYIEMFNEVSNSVNEENYGLDDYFPLQADVGYDQNQNIITVNIPDNNLYVNTEQIFQNVLEESFRYQHISKIQFESEEKSGVEFSHAGNIQGVEVTLYPKRAMYVGNFGGSYTTLFVPSEHSFETLLEALEAMKEGTSFDGIQASISSNIEFENIENDGENVIITFSEGTMLENDEQYQQTIEAILLTARDFGFNSVTFKNSTADTIGSFNMNESLEVPVAPNVVELPH